jgi:predicted flavoprotein YhiN
MLASTLKSLAVPLKSPRPIAEAISSAGGIAWDSLSESLMLKAIPGTFAAGEMLDWEVTTGGYLLTACMALGKWAGDGAANWLGLPAVPD